MSIASRWTVRVKTPIGGVTAVFTFVDTGDAPTGTAESGGEVTEMRGLVAVPHADGTTVLHWAQSVTTPMRLDLEFEVSITGDTLIGASRAGSLPRASVEGYRI